MIHFERGFPHMGFFHGHGFMGRGGRGGRRGERPLRRGIMKFAILQLLAEAGRHGYDLMKAFKEKGWAGGAGSIYPLLSALEEGGFIEGRDEGERRTYDITEKGRRKLEEHAAEFGAFFHGGGEADEEDGEPNPRRDLRDSVERLIQAVSQIGQSSKTETVVAVRERLDRIRKEIYALLAEE
jgi:DNA-binding PadR family transcriptional regulator